MDSRIPAVVFPPGEFIREELDARGWTQSDLAAILDRPVETVSMLITGKRSISPDTAHGLGEAFGTGAEYWINLETAHQLAASRKESGGVALRAKLYDRAPVNEMVRRGWISGSRNADELKQQLLAYYGISTMDGPIPFVAAARKTESGDGHSPSQVAWLTRAKQLAATLDVRKFSKRTLRTSLRTLRELAVNREDAGRVPALLAELGVRFVVVKHLSKTKIDGAAFWLPGKSPVVVLSLRYDRIDNFWFTLLHEIGHVLRGDTLSVDSDILSLDRESTLEEMETAANSFASDLVVPNDQMDNFIKRHDPLYAKSKIRGFAARIDIHPGIVVGQLRHRGKIGHNHSSEMLVKVRDIIIQSALTDGWGNMPPAVGHVNVRQSD